MNPTASRPLVAIACGGTGGHLFPGLAVAGELQRRGCDIALLISPKDIDQQAVKTVQDVEIFTLPAVGLQDRNYISFGRSFWKSYLAASKVFQTRRPAAVLAMGGFTSAPPVLAARRFGAKTFLHESNTVPGKANRFLSRFVDVAFVGFPEAAARLHGKKTVVTGTPVRPQFCGGRRGEVQAPDQKIQSLMASADEKNCRIALGLDPVLPAVLIVGGSQGARGLNDLVLSALPLLKSKHWQWLHLTGAADFEKVKAAYPALGIRADVKPFFAEMGLALGAATACISRSGASSLAEIAAMRLPSALVPLPTSADNHQFFNATAFEKSGAARLLDQKNSLPDKVAAAITELVESDSARRQIQTALGQWHAPQSAEEIAGHILTSIAAISSQPSQSEEKAGLKEDLSPKIVV